LILRYVKDQFTDSYNVTVGVEFLVKKVEVNNKTIALQLWDTVGGVETGGPRALPLRSEDLLQGLGLCADLLQPAQVVGAKGSRKSFESVEGWIKTIKDSTEVDPLLVLLGTQSDLDRWPTLTPESCPPTRPRPLPTNTILPSTKNVAPKTTKIFPR
jgi:Ras-related protein Rab-6A